MTTWCECGEHLIDPAAGRGLCPVCIDQAAKDADAKVAAMIARLSGETG